MSSIKSKITRNKKKCHCEKEQAETVAGRNSPAKTLDIEIIRHRLQTMLKMFMKIKDEVKDIYISPSRFEKELNRSSRNKKYKATLKKSFILETNYIPSRKFLRNKYKT